MTHDELRKTASEAVRKALIQPMCCMQGSGCEFPPCHCSTVAADAVLAAVWEALREPDDAATDAAWATFYRVEPGEAPSWGDVHRAMVRFIAASPLRPAASAEGVG